MNYQRGSNQAPSPAIRAGLSVQELKAMTAMRVATTNDAPRGYANNMNTSKFPSVNPASSYQTATPQQLQAAGIQASVVSQQPKPRMQKQNVQAGYSEDSFYNRPTPTTGLGYSSSQQQQQTTLSPYHQQLLVGNKGVQNVQSVKELTKIRLQNEASLYAETPTYGGSRAEQLQHSNAALYGRAAPRSNAPPLRGLFGGAFQQEEDEDGDSYYHQQQQHQFGQGGARQQFSQQPVGPERRGPTNRQQQLLQQQYNSEDESDYALNSMLASYDRSHQTQGAAAPARRDGGMGFVPPGLLPQTTSRLDDGEALYDFQQQQLGLSDDDGQDYSGGDGYFTQALQGHNLPGGGSGKQHFSDSFGELSQLDREMALKMSVSMAPSTSLPGGPRKLGTIMKSKSQPLIPLGAFSSHSPSLSPLPGRSALHGFVLPELDSHSPTTSRENTPKQPLSKRSPLTAFASPSDSFLLQPTASPAGLLPTIKQTRSALRLSTGSPLNSPFPRKQPQQQGNFSGSLGSIDSTDGIDDYLTNEMAESVLGGLNTPRDTPKLGQIGKGFSFTKDVNEYRATHSHGNALGGIASPATKRDLFAGFMQDAAAHASNGDQADGGRFEWTLSGDEQDDGKMNKRSNNNDEEDDDLLGPLSRHSSGLSAGAYSASTTPRHHRE